MAAIDIGPILQNILVDIRKSLGARWDGLSDLDRQVIEKSAEDALALAVAKAGGTDVPPAEMQHVKAQLSVVAGIAAEDTAAVVWRAIVRVLAIGAALASEALQKLRK